MYQKGVLLCGNFILSCYHTVFLVVTMAFLCGCYFVLKTSGWFPGHCYTVSKVLLPYSGWVPQSYYVVSNLFLEAAIKL